jgi:hypothetical protein
MAARPSLYPGEGGEYRRTEELIRSSTMRLTFDDVRHWLFVLLALAAVGCAIARICGVTTVDRDVLLFLTVAGVFLVLERIRQFSLTKDGLTYEIDEIKGAVSEVQKRVGEQQELINKLVETSMSDSAFRHLAGIALLREDKYYQSPTVLDFVYLPRGKDTP